MRKRSVASRGSLGIVANVVPRASNQWPSQEPKELYELLCQGHEISPNQKLTKYLVRKQRQLQNLGDNLPFELQQVEQALQEKRYTLQQARRQLAYNQHYKAIEMAESGSKHSTLRIEELRNEAHIANELIIESHYETIQEEEDKIKQDTCARDYYELHEKIDQLTEKIKQGEQQKKRIKNILGALPKYQEKYNNDGIDVYQTTALEQQTQSIIDELGMNKPERKEAATGLLTGNIARKNVENHPVIMTYQQLQAQPYPTDKLSQWFAKQLHELSPEDKKITVDKLGKRLLALVNELQKRKPGYRVQELEKILHIDNPHEEKRKGNKPVLRFTGIHGAELVIFDEHLKKPSQALAKWLVQQLGGTVSEEGNLVGITANELGAYVTQALTQGNGRLVLGSRDLAGIVNKEKISRKSWAGSFKNKSKKDPSEQDVTLSWPKVVGLRNVLLPKIEKESEGPNDVLQQIVARGKGWEKERENQNGRASLTTLMESIDQITQENQTKSEQLFNEIKTFDDFTAWLAHLFIHRQQQEALLQQLRKAAIQQKDYCDINAQGIPRNNLCQAGTFIML